MAGRSRVGRATDPSIAEHGDRAHHLGLSRLQSYQLSEEALRSEGVVQTNQAQYHPNQANQTHYHPNQVCYQPN